MLSYSGTTSHYCPRNRQTPSAGNSLPVRRNSRSRRKGLYGRQKIIIETSNERLQWKKILLAFIGERIICIIRWLLVSHPNWWISTMRILRASLSDFTRGGTSPGESGTCARSRLYQRLESYECKLLLVCLAEHDDSGRFDLRGHG